MGVLANFGLLQLPQPLFPLGEGTSESHSQPSWFLPRME